MARDVLVVAEKKGGSLRQVTLEALAAARLMSQGGKVCAALLGGYKKEEARLLSDYGADELVVVEEKELLTYHTDTHMQALLAVIQECQPEVVIMGHTFMGKDLSPRMAAALDIGLVSDCTALEMEAEELLFTRPIYSGKAFAKIRVKEIPFMVTIRPNNIERQLDPDRPLASIREIEVTLEESRTKQIKMIQKTGGQVDLSEAKVIVAGGRGVRSSQGFEPLRQLAQILGGAVGASRGACDADYCDYALQIGQTGKVVTPDLYIACGISGAIQHLAGMSHSKVIVAINTDPEAEIFQVADYGIVGDLFEIVPLLTKELSKQE